MRKRKAGLIKVEGHTWLANLIVYSGYDSLQAHALLHSSMYAIMQSQCTCNSASVFFVVKERHVYTVVFQYFDARGRVVRRVS